MSKKKFALLTVASLAWLGLLAGGDCEIDLDLDGWGHYFGDYGYYEEVIYYDPWYPCCY